MHIRYLGQTQYLTTWEAMKKFTQQRTIQTPDEIWLLEHDPVYTQGQAGKPEHLLHSTQIPVIQSDRGGQITYHGPGQMVAYILIDLRKKNMGIRTLVCQLEQTLLELLAHWDIQGQTRCGAPGVYVAEKKIASIGLRVKNGCTYHGIALNVDMDLTPFQAINPCGYSKLEMTQVREHTQSNITLTQASHLFVDFFKKKFTDH